MARDSLLIPVSECDDLLSYSLIAVNQRWKIEFLGKHFSSGLSHSVGNYWNTDHIAEKVFNRAQPTSKLN